MHPRSMSGAKRRALILLVPMLPLAAQVKLPPGSREEARAASTYQNLRKAPSPDPLRCEVHRFPPRLSYGLRYWAGYQVDLALKSAAGARRWAILVRVQPEGGEPVYLFQRRTIPTAAEGVRPPANAQYSAGGGFFLGMGRYQVEWFLVDDKGRYCRSSWSVKTPGSKLSLQQAPLTVDSPFREGWKGLNAEDGPGARLTLLLNAAPFLRRRHQVKLSAYERGVLLDSLTSFLDRSGASEARVVVFDLERRRILAEEDRFDPRGFRRLAEKMMEAEYGTIPYQVLLSGGSEFDMIDSLLARETGRDGGGRAIVFLGPMGGMAGRRPRPDPAITARPAGIYYLALTNPQASPGDAIQKTVRQWGGKTFAVYGPADLAKAADALRPLVRLAELPRPHSDR